MDTYLTIYFSDRPNAACLAIPATSILSLLSAKDVPVTGVPQSAEHFDGMFSWSGEFVALCHLGRLLGEEERSAMSASERVIVLEGQIGPFAIRVRTLGTLVRIQSDQRRSAETLLGASHSDVCPQVYLCEDNRLLWLVNTAALEARARSSLSLPPSSAVSLLAGASNAQA